MAAFQSSAGCAFFVLLASLAQAQTNIVTLSDLPYKADFEVSENYSCGPLGGQLGWSVPQGDAEIISTDAFAGSRSVLLPPGNPVSQALVRIPLAGSQTVAYVDLYAKPAADALVDQSTLIDAGPARIGFLLAAGGAFVEAFDGDGRGGGTWAAPMADTYLVLASGSSEASGWHRFTFREDFSAKTWDLYVDGRMVGYGFGFRDSTVFAIRNFGISGHQTSSAGLDDLSAGFQNPLFKNSSNDGISDTWKILHGLDPSKDVRTEELAGTSVPAVREYVKGIPNDVGGIVFRRQLAPASTEITYTYDASGRLVGAQYGNSASQKFSLDNAANLTSVSTTAGQ